VVGLDPRWDQLPPSLQREPAPQAFERFCWGIIEAVRKVAVAVKPQSAFFERYGSAGVAAFERVCRVAREAGLIVIGDVKRGDIGSTAEAYAEGLLGAESPVDAITVNPYLGFDAVEPFIEVAARNGKGVFVLVRTSNPSARDVQDLESGGEPLYLHVGRLVREWGREYVGDRGYSHVGAVVGATYPEEAGRLRAELPGVPFLVPGYGAQGAGAADVAPAFDAEGLGAVVNSSRGIIFAYQQERYAARPGPADLVGAARAAAEDMRREIQAVLGA